MDDLSGPRSLSGSPAVGLSEEAAGGVPWLADLAGSGPEWAWPRLMTAVHPRAVGSYGAEAVAAIEGWSGRPLWPWQQLVLARVLEHDGAGRLVWRSVGLSVPRQQGKSTVVGELAAWRLQSGARFGGQQNVLLVARDVGASVTVQKPHRVRADADRNRFKPSSAGGRLSIEWLADGSEWLIRSSEGVYSYSAVMAIADEAWDLSPSVVDDGLHPVILQQSDAQLWVVSTANPKATGLMSAVGRPPSSSSTNRSRNAVDRVVRASGRRCRRPAGVARGVPTLDTGDRRTVRRPVRVRRRAATL